MIESQPFSFIELFDLSEVRFRNCTEVRGEIQSVCEEHGDLASYHQIGLSEEGRPIDAVVIGRGPEKVSLIAGSHADEPVGPESLRHLILQGLKWREKLLPLWENFTVCIIPQVNPDGEFRNQRWIQQWPDLHAYVQYAFREPPGRDIEFGYPDMRPENRAVAAFLKEYAPLALHISLHGMGFSDGVMLLIEKHWIKRSLAIQSAFIEFAQAYQLPLHDYDRKGEKGFRYIGPGFTTTPEGRAMREYFHVQNQPEIARRFYLSSMEYVRELGGDPLCLVTELPLFMIHKQPVKHQPGRPDEYLSFKERLTLLKRQEDIGRELKALSQEFQLTHFKLNLAIQFHLRVIEWALLTVKGA